MRDRLSINDPRLNWEDDPPLITIDGLEYYLLARYVANRDLQIVKCEEKTQTPISGMNHAFHSVILDFAFTQMLMLAGIFGTHHDTMTIFSSVADIEQEKLAYVEERKPDGKIRLFPDITSRGTPVFPYNTKFLQTPRFNLIDGFWHPAEDGEYEDVFCCMEMVPIACSIRFKSLLPA